MTLLELVRYFWAERMRKRVMNSKICLAQWSGAYMMEVRAR